LKISIITPAFNEAENIEICVSEVAKMMEQQLPNWDYEHIICDNSSTDRTVEIVKKLASSNNKIKYLVNSRNVGPYQNMWIGMKVAGGDVVVPLLPADLQDPPSAIPKFIESWEKGFLVVRGRISKRHEKWLMRNIRSLFYKTISLLAVSEIPLDSGEFMLIDKKVLQTITCLEDPEPYIRGLVALTGVKYDVVLYEKVPRRYGKSKENILTYLNHSLNALISTSRILPRLMLLVGLVVSTFSILLAIYSLLVFIFARPEIGTGIPLLLIGTFLLGGIQILFLGLLGEYVVSIHRQTRPHPKPFIVDSN